jgi:excisionase family DNA binding protein
MNDTLMNTVQVAERLGMSREQVWRLWSTGRLPGYKLDRNVRFDRTDVERFMQANYSGNATTPPVALPARRSPATAYRRL